MDFQKYNEIVKNKITNIDGTEEIRRYHTDMLIKCSAGDKQAKDYIRSMIKGELNKLNVKQNEIESLVDEIYASNWGLGPIEKYDTDDIDEIMVHGTRILIQKKGEVIEVPEKFENIEATIAVMRRCLEFNKSKDLNPKNAVVMAKRMDGSRITAVIPPVGKVPYLNIRKFKSFTPTTENLLESNTLSEEEIEALETLAKGRANIVVIGEMGSGKTTFMKWLIQFLSEKLVVGIMETVAEINADELYPNRYWVQLEETDDYELPELFSAQLRQNVDVMLVGESRSYEVNELIKAMSRGHSGSIGTAHSIGPEEVIDDFADMILESGKNIEIKPLRYRIARAIDIVVKFRKTPNKNRVCAGIYEIITDKETQGYYAETLFEFQVDEENPADRGNHVKVGTISKRLRKKLNEYGVKMSEINRVFGEIEEIEE